MGGLPRREPAESSARLKVFDGFCNLCSGGARWVQQHRIKPPTGNAAAIRVVSEKVVLADWQFKVPAIIAQLLRGLALVKMRGIRCRMAGSPGH